MGTTISLLAVMIGILGGFVAEALLLLIRLMTNLAFGARLSFDAHGSGTPLPVPWLLLVPALGGLIVGAIARWGSAAIRGHGIPEVMDQVLHGESRIPPRLTILKPLSAAIAIGTGGPFGAEGPIIATGGALGSLLGQVVHVSADERKTLLAAGAAAGMAATFGSPVSAVLLAIELLLFEYRAASIIPVALAASAATAVRLALVGGAPVFPMPDVAEPSGTALVTYTLIGAAMGLASVVVTRSVYWIEDRFEDLPISWVWWPALGGLVVGACGLLDPRILGVGYENITAALSGGMTVASLAVLVGLKFGAWSVALGSGTSGGTLAPLFTFGSGLGAIVGTVLARHAPGLGVVPSIAALVGMAAIFAGASRALLASVVFAFETTRQPVGLLPLLAGCCAAYFISRRLMRHSIMTEKLARRGARVLDEYAVDHLARVSVGEAMSSPVMTLDARETVLVASARLVGPGAITHQGFPVLSPAGQLVGVLTRRDLLAPQSPSTPVGELIRREPIVVTPDDSLRGAADAMVRAAVGRLPVVDPATGHLMGIITRSDLLRAHAPRLEAAEHRTGPVRLPRRRHRRPSP